MEIALSLLTSVLVFAIVYEFFKNYYGAARHIEEAELAPKEEVVAEVKAVEAEVTKAEKDAAPKTKAAKKATSKKSVAVEEAAPVVKKPKIKIAT